MNKFLLHPATFKLDGGAMFGIIPKPLWEKKIKPDNLNRIKMSLRIIYIEIGDKKVLIDTGIGDYHGEKFSNQFEIQGKQNPINKILKENFDTTCDQITDIILTHLHFDHVGGLINKEDQEGLTFPNATIHVHKKHYEYSLSPTLRDSGSFQSNIFLPLFEKYIAMDSVNFLTEDSGVILNSGSEQIKYKVSFGHTPYMIHPILDEYIYMADLVPMAHHLKLPWVMGYDIEPGVTTTYKKKFYDYIIENNLTMIFEHDIDCWGATLEVNDKKQYSLKKVFTTDNNEVIEII